jgi:hypothetical protein
LLHAVHAGLSPPQDNPVRGLIAIALLILSVSSCDNPIKKWLEEREASRREEAAKAAPDYIPPECRYPYGLYRVFSHVAWNYPACAKVIPFSNNSVVWWGGTDSYGPDHKATRVRKQGCIYEYAGGHFVGTETRDRFTKEAKPEIIYEGTWTESVPAWGISCVATGLEWFVKETDP